MLRKSRKIESLVFQNRLLKDAHSISDKRLFLFNQFRLRQESKVQGSLVRNDIAVISSYFPGLWKGITVLIIFDSLSLRLRKLVHCRWEVSDDNACIWMKNHQLYRLLYSQSISITFVPYSYHHEILYALEKDCHNSNNFYSKFINLILSPLMSRNTTLFP